MNSVLVIFILYGSTFVPEYAISYPTEEACASRIHDFDVFPKHQRKAICVPPAASVKLEPANEVNVLTEQQIKALGVKEEVIYTREK